VNPEAQSLDVKRAEVEFHSFASFGEPERASNVYREENRRRGSVLESLAGFLGEPFAETLTPFLEIGANAGHTSLLLTNEFGADGFALDISADSLRHGYALMERWNVSRGPMRVAGDALKLPFRDNSLRFVIACQMLSQFMDIEAVFLEVKRVLMPGGVFFFCEEPMRRLMTLRLWRAPYYEQMTPWERRLWDWGVLPFLVRDVVGAGQEESFGIRQNHTMYLSDWRALLERHFQNIEYRLFVPERGPWEKAVKRAAIRLDPHRSVWRAARLLGGTLAAAGRKEGMLPQEREASLERLLACPDCGSGLEVGSSRAVHCAGCSYTAAFDEGVYNLLPSLMRAELYPGDRTDTADFSRPGHEARLLDGWHELEGVYGNNYRWMGQSASLRLENIRGGAQRLRVRGFRPESAGGATLRIDANGERIGDWPIDRPGLFVIETPLPDAPAYEVRLTASPVWSEPRSDRKLSVNISLVRLLPLHPV
jgi:SAM-dependent methyltransferase